MFRLVVFCAFFLMFLRVNAQQMDTIRNNNKPTKDTITVKDAAKEIGFKDKARDFTKEVGLLFRDTSELQNPRKAVLRSAILPGWGQIRNRKWWKVPLVYGGFVGLGLVYEFNQRYYKELLTESQFRKANQNLPLDSRFKYERYKGISDDQIYNAKDFYRRNRDLTLYSTFGFYLLQMVDAYIDAKLATFDVSDDLSLKIKPSVYAPVYANGGGYAPMPALTLNLKFK
ncbi:hypothetical protein BCY91_02855 [Pelobium manganitolerans]|uniref:DUF5683 domain-containing protein n=1 Tax=Pelobium manganitolerans TaxID=1842495 RepID=A0A419S766_9SPHI|nr:DUF5683 domain-containing protein [Pelobium manganitolerans]RKD17103.1 hypothetical protein BCY91_02855 [Pelobium manganitolerans]